LIKYFYQTEHITQYQAIGKIVNKWGSTTHILINLNIESNAASITTSHGEGSGYVIGTGIMDYNKYAWKEI